jgi:hypothetical protein
VTLTNDTAIQGGAVYNSGTATLTHVTIARNTATIGGGVAETSWATTILANSIIAENTGGDVIGANSTPYDKATNFDGLNDHIVLPPAGLTNLAGGFSVGVWVNPAVDNVNHILDIGNGPSEDSVVISRSGTSNSIYVYVCQAGGTNGSSVEVSNMIETNKWQYITVTVDANRNVSMFKNGVLMGTGTLSFMPRNVLRTSNFVGRSNWPNEPYFKGQMNSLSIWNRDLSAADIDNKPDTAGLGHGFQWLQRLYFSTFYEPE